MNYNFKEAGEGSLGVGKNELSTEEGIEWKWKESDETWSMNGTFDCHF